MGQLEGLEEIDQLLDEMIKECRMIINNFGISLENANLKNTFISLAEKMGKVYSGNINVDWSGEEFVDDLKLATNIFRIYQEALSNAIKYSGSKRIDVFVENNGNIQLEVKDEGGGFDTKTGKGFGLTNMSDRAKEIGYLFEVISSIDKGTRVLLKPDI